MAGRRIVGVLVALMVGLSGVVLMPASPAGASVVTERPVYGRNEAVIIDVGQITYTTACSQGVRDWIYPIADIYVVKGSTPPSGGLSDVSGTPNTVFGVTGGGIFGEVIGYTKPAGALGPGTYSVVIDECQDKQFGPEDTFVPDAFRVVSHVVGPQLPNIGALKAKAQEQATHYQHAVLAWKALLALSGKGQGSAGKAYGYFMKISHGLGAPNPAAIATLYLGNMGKHYEGIAADPPDPAFAQPTVLAPTVAPTVLDPTDPVDLAAAEASGPLATSAALTEGVLRSLERYQGAWAARDGEWQLAHARGVQDNARLLADQVLADAAALGALADAIDALPGDHDTVAADTVAAIDAFLASGPTPEETADLTNQGFTTGEMNAILGALRAEIDGFARADLTAALRAVADGAPDEAAALDALAADMQPVIDALAADPFVEGTVPVVDAGGPYTAAVGGTLQLDGSGTTGVEPLAFEWDLDGDGTFDDATGPTPAVVPAGAFTGLAGLRVTAAGGEVGVGYAPIEITGGPAGPSIADPIPADRRSVTVAAGSTEPFSVTAGGDAPETIWHLDGVEVATGTTFDYSPVLADAGPHLIDVVATDASGQQQGLTWYVSVTAPDADGDDYWAHVDCDDDEPTTYPGAPELLDGVDNDCDPSTPDGGVAPDVPALTPLAAPEGTTVEVVRSFTHPSGTYTATVDWGDGTVTPGTITSKTVRASHAYADDGTYTVEVCVTATAGRTGCNTGTATISNVAAGPRFSTLFDWTKEDTTPNAGNWTVAPDGLSVFQSINGNPTYFLSDAPLAPGVEAGVTLTVETTADDDYVGFALGVHPGFTQDPDADFLLIDWKQADQGSGACASDRNAERGLAVSRVTGTPPAGDYWGHVDCADDGSTFTELARATNLHDTGWQDNTSYQFRFRYSETRLQIWVDDVLEFDLTGDFPQGHFAFYNYSQSSVRYSGYQLRPGDVVEGTERLFEVDFEDPGVADTHTGTIDWGDGTPNDALVIEEADGVGTGSKAHRYLDDGTYDGEVCITDDDGATACQQFPVDVANAAPDVDAGRDRTTGPDVVLVDSVFEDPGVLDTHTATIDWGDGSPLDDGAVDEVLGEGIVTGGHTYDADGTYTVEVCVTDDDGATACDSFDVDVRVANAGPLAETDPDVDALEGDVVARAVAFTDPNPDDSHTATIDWGDGGEPEEVDLAEEGGIGTGGAVHQYLDDGTYLVTVEVCDTGAVCDTEASTVTVANVAPDVTVDGEVVAALVSTGSTGGTGARSLPVEVTASFTDPGVVDTHTALVDWGDGSDPEPVVVDQGAGSGSLAASHVYDQPGEYEIEVCVTDDDDGTGCDLLVLAPGGAPPGPPLDVSAIGGDGNARVRWEPPADDGGSPLLEYELETTPGGATVTVPADELVAIVEGLDNETAYTFRVRASNQYGWGPWSAPSNLTRPRPSCPGAIFDDVGPTHPFCPEIKWMADTGVSIGFPGNVYRPAQALTRQQMAAFAYRLLNPGTSAPPCTTQPFTDVQVDNPLCGEIAWMKAEGISGGRPDGSFGARQPVTRQTMAAFLYRLTDPGGPPPPPCTQDEFPDVPAGHLFCGEIDWLVDNGITGGFDDGTFRPTVAVARQQMAAFIFRYNILTGHVS